MTRQQICDNFIKHMVHANENEFPLAKEVLLNLHKTIIVTNKIIKQYPLDMKRLLIAKTNKEILNTLKENYNLPLLDGWCIIKEFRKYISK